MTNEVEPRPKPKGASAADDRTREDKALAERLGALELRLKAAAGNQAVPPAQGGAGEANSSGPSGLGQALRLSGEFTAGIIVGGGLGWAVDRWLGTSPFGMILFVMLGFAAGMMNAMRAAGMLKPARGRGTKDS
jgi:ATP synthase protein I